MVFSRSRVSMPSEDDALPCGSRSIMRVRNPISAKQAPRFTVEVVFATPPLLLETAMMRGPVAEVDMQPYYSRLPLWRVDGEIKCSTWNIVFTQKLPVSPRLTPILADNGCSTWNIRDLFQRSVFLVKRARCSTNSGPSSPAAATTAAFQRF